MTRFRDFGFNPGALPPGALNKISDVPGVTVGHCTRIEGERIRTGVTIIDPGVANLLHDKRPAAVAVGNGFGKAAGLSQIDEVGTLESPIALTNTLAVGAVLHGLVELILKEAGPLPPAMTVNAVVGETNDGQVNDIHRIVLGVDDVAAAWADRTRDFALGAVGAGTGTSCFGWKGGIGSASRMAVVEGRAFHVGALLQTNFGGALTIMGVPVGTLLGQTDFEGYAPPRPDGSCMMILATDAPLSARQLGRVARRAVMGLARTGSIMGQGSGDYAIAFSVNRARVEGAGLSDGLPDKALNPLFLAAVEAVEESVYDSLFMSETVSGRDGNTLERIPVERVVEILKKRIES